jgi:hypothetical protein
MPTPWELRVDGINAGANLLELPAYSSPTTPYVLPETISLSQAATGGGASLSFEVVQNLTTGGTPWFSTNTFGDNARVRFFDTRAFSFASGTPIFMGYITTLDAKLTGSGQGVVVSVAAQDPTAWLEKTIIRKGKIGSSRQNTGTFYSKGITDQAIITELLGYVNGKASGSYTQDAETKKIFNASLTPYWYGGSTTIGSQLIEVATLSGAIETIRSLAEGKDGVIRRAWVDATGRLNYGKVGTAPANATAPFAVITSGTPSVGSSSTPTTVFANSISVSLDHNAQIDRIITRTASWDSALDRGTASSTGNSTDPYVRTAGSAAPRGPGTAFARPAGPRSEVLFELGSFRGLDNSNRANFVDSFNNATFALSFKPKRSISLTIAGAGSSTATPDHSFGFVQGYTGASPYTLRKYVQAGDYLKISAPNLDIPDNTLLRIESLTMSFPQGGAIAQLDLELDFRRKGLREIILGES